MREKILSAMLQDENFKPTHDKRLKQFFLKCSLSQQYAINEFMILLCGFFIESQIERE